MLEKLAAKSVGWPHGPRSAPARKAVETFPYREYSLVPALGTMYIVLVQIIARRTLRQFWEKHSQAETPLRNWYATAAVADWKGPADIKKRFGAAVDFAADNRAIFDIAGNKYRLIVHISYRYGRVLIKFIGTHKEYDRIDPNTV